MTEEMHEIMTQRFGRDCLIALATADGGTPHVRAVNAYYKDGAFYCVTDLRSGKMRQIENNSAVAICGDWFTGHGRGESLGHILAPQNRALADALRLAFASWYHNGHIDETDPHTIILKITLTDGVLMSHGKRYVL